MELDLQGEHAARSYAALVSLVFPPPISWVTTVNVDGAINAAPFSFFNVLGSKPPIVGICPGDREGGLPKDTARNIRLTHEFVVNLVDEALAEPMNPTAASPPYGIREPGMAGRPRAPPPASPRQSGMRGMGDSADWRQPTDYRFGEADPGPRCLDRSENVADPK